ncbi:MAG TPA: hypothetical protein VFR00_02190 [Hyphomicrobiaceae bacterium]|jgi:hypothetical protein|nr:hypothetical protein [Hyphomicrobiaceae bacterium]
MSEDNARPRIGAELAKIEAEPLLPIEKKLLAWSLIAGVVLLGLLVWTGNSALPLGH